MQAVIRLTHNFSVTPVLCRLVEKLVVEKWLRPAIPSVLISDQYPFKLTGYQLLPLYILLAMPVKCWNTVILYSA